MPKVRPLTESQRAKARWQAQDDNFRMQIGALVGRMGRKPDCATLGALLGVKDCRAIRRVMNSPEKMTKGQERALMLAFERVGMRYDPTLGEGARA